MKIDDGRFAGILRYYKNTALQTVRDVTLPALYECERLGHWPKGTSRRVRATLNKTHGDLTGEAKSGAIMCHGDPIAIEYGQFERAPKMLAQAAPIDRANAHPHVLAYLTWCELFAPVATLVHTLDAERPKPEYVIKQISPTIYANVAEQMGLDFSTVEIPPIKWVKEKTIVGGKEVTMWIGYPQWPEGTRHNRSRYHWSAAGNEQCQACGHAIKSGKFVPLVLRSNDGPRSLWTGRDCAEHFFGCKVTGESNGQFKIDATDATKGNIQ